MSTNLYCYERGACRGDEFTNKITLDKTDTIDTINKAIDLIGTDDYDDFMDGLFDGDNYTESNVVYALIQGSDCCNGLTPQQRLVLIREGNSFTMEMEESTIGFGATKQAAKLAYIADNDDGDEW